MRVIFNLHSHIAAEAAGWRAKEIHFDGSEVILEDILKSTKFTDSETAYDYIFEDGNVKSDFRFFANGIMRLDTESLKTPIKDNTQFHLMDKH